MIARASKGKNVQNYVSRMHLPLDYFSTEARLTFHVSELKSDINYIKYYTFLTRYNKNNNTDAILFLAYLILY